MAAVTSTEWIRFESLSMLALIYRFAGLRLDAEVALVALIGLLHLRIPLPRFVLVPPAHSGFALVKAELGAAIKVASTIVPWLMVMPR